VKKMNKVLYIILISLFSLTVISCAEKEESSSSSTTTTTSGLYVAVGNGGTILTSADGTTWTSRTSGITNDLWGDHYGNSTFVTVGDSGTILTSSDGTSWDNRTSGTTNTLYGVTYKE